MVSNWYINFLKMKIINFPAKIFIYSTWYNMKNDLKTTIYV